MNEPQEDVNTPTAKLMDEEVKTEADKRATISKLTLEIEQILLRENMTMGDFLEIVGLFTNRANRVFSLKTIKEINETYGNS